MCLSAPHTPCLCVSSVCLCVCLCVSVCSSSLISVNNKRCGRFSGLESKIPFPQHQQCHLPQRKTLSGLIGVNVAVTSNGAAARLSLLYCGVSRSHREYNINSWRIYEMFVQMPQSFAINDKVPSKGKTYFGVPTCLGLLTVAPHCHLVYRGVK